jgi:N-acetylneuraminic acid mutarotase
MLVRSVALPLWLAAALLTGPAALRADDRPADGGPTFGTWGKKAAGPGKRYANQIVWDSHKKRVLLFGGETNPQFALHGDLWAYTPKTDRWQELKPKGKKPAYRAYFAACYDGKRKGMWLHGGFNPKFLDDLWFFDSEKETWKEVAVKGARPSGRDGHDIFYNPKKDELILLGGLTDFTKFTVNDELWVFNIAKGTWSKKATGPSGRLLYCGAFDDKAQRLYINGGFGARGEAVGSKLWTYDVASDKWTSEKGGGRNYAAGRMVLLADEGRLLIFGGGDTHAEYAYDIKAKRWTGATKLAPPPARSYHAMCLDPDGRRVYVFGGTTGGFAGPNVAADLWVLELPPRKGKGSEKN